ncbi:uncharacterized protein LOC18011085 [Eutrema salsugineum]|uniref:uncharacterized protein LOC18011085 n=1 Tax=Eutrema salsugineum TaxID=72664 RepID=UPI000CED49A4|nr:uncharacterized protein LOC18011085 [Eutrema salsugineum]
MPNAWSLIGQVEAQVNDDDTVNFYFKKEHHLMTVLEGGPYKYIGWMIVLDRWSNMRYPSFLRYIPFWIKINKLHAMYQKIGIVNSIGSKLGHVDEVLITEQIKTHLPEVWVKVDFDVDSTITLARSVEIMPNTPPVELEFKNTGLQKLCTTCGSFKHGYEVCPKGLSLPPQIG